MLSGDLILGDPPHPWDDPGHDVMADLRTYAQEPTGDAPWLATDKMLAEIAEWNQAWHRRILDRLSTENRIIGFDREGTVVYESDLWDQNIEPDEVLRVGGFYYRTRVSDVGVPEWARGERRNE